MLYDNTNEVAHLLSSTTRINQWHPYSREEISRKQNQRKSQNRRGSCRRVYGPTSLCLREYPHKAASLSPFLVSLAAGGPRLVGLWHAIAGFSILIERSSTQ